MRFLIGSIKSAIGEICILGNYFDLKKGLPPKKTTPVLSSSVAGLKCQANTKTYRIQLRTFVFFE